jgi:SMI1 / KNR4 family (SUKH-1)
MSGTDGRGERSWGAFLVGATADSIWRVPAYLPYLQPPLTDKAIASAEKQIGYDLPTEYLHLLKKQNGGYIRFSLPEMVHDSIAGIGPHFPSLTGFDWDECQDHVSFPLRGLVPFDGDGNWHLCLDYRQDSSGPSITHADIECDRESRIADSFADYLAMLKSDVGDEYVLEGLSEIEKVKANLSLSLSLTFEAPDTWAHGYPTHRARLGTKNNPEWIWISPNTVHRGFVRSDDPRFAELKDLMPGYASRFPEVPADSYMLTVTDGVRSKVIDACVRTRMVIRPLREYVNGIK